MAEKKSKIHGLVLFKGPQDKEKSDESTYSFERVDQENKIKMSHELVPFGTSYRYGILLVNESMAPITEIKARIKFPEFLIVTRINPTTISISPQSNESGAKQINFEIDELSENSKNQINLYFKPLLLNKKGKISTNVSFVNNKDFIRVLDSEPAEINIVEPKIEGKIIPSSKIVAFLNTKGIKKTIKSLGIATKEKEDMNLYFNHIEQLMGLHKFQLITKDENKKIAWFYGMDLNTKEDVLVIGQIVSNKIEFLAASQHHSGLISLLTMLSNEFKKRILSIGKIKSIEDIYELECKYCGGVFDRFPAKGESIECKNCSRVQTIW
ncbi:MAG: hypothetical protein ACFFDK_07890 [Promethearchaeota archaeon]